MNGQSRMAQSYRVDPPVEATYPFAGGRLALTLMLGISV